MGFTLRTRFLTTIEEGVIVLLTCSLSTSMSYRNKQEIIMHRITRRKVIVATPANAVGDTESRTSCIMEEWERRRTPETNLFQRAMIDWMYWYLDTDSQRLNNPRLSIADGKSTRPSTYTSRTRIAWTTRTIIASLTPLPEHFVCEWQDDFLGCSMQVLFWQKLSTPHEVPSFTNTECMGLEILLLNEKQVVFSLHDSSRSLTCTRKIHPGYWHEKSWSSTKLRVGTEVHLHSAVNHIWHP